MKNFFFFEFLEIVIFGWNLNKIDLENRFKYRWIKGFGLKKYKF